MKLFLGVTYLVFICNFCFAQQRIQYPDSLKGVVLKIEPGAIFYDHTTVGIELGLKGNKFLEFNLGLPGLGLNSYYVKPGGIIIRTGVKIPFSVNTSPFSLLYFMPELILSRFHSRDYFYSNSSSTNYFIVNSQALLFSFGYRHVNPVSGFYYDAGLGLGIAGSNHPLGRNSLAFTMSANNDYGNSTTPESITGIAFGARLGFGLVIKKKTRKQ